MMTDCQLFSCNMASGIKFVQHQLTVIQLKQANCETSVNWIGHRQDKL